MKSKHKFSWGDFVVVYAVHEKQKNFNPSMYSCKLNWKEVPLKTPVLGMISRLTTRYNGTIDQVDGFVAEKDNRLYVVSVGLYKKLVHVKEENMKLFSPSYAQETIMRYEEEFVRNNS